MWIRIWRTLHKYGKEIILKLIENDTLTWTLLQNEIIFSKTTLNKYLTSLEDKRIVVYKIMSYVEDKMLIRYRGFYPII